MLLQVKDLTVLYEKAEVLRKISLFIEEGEIITIIGPNGAGKTTTLKAISGLLKPKTGEIWYQGERIDGMTPQAVVRRGIAQVPEGRRVFRDMSVLHNLKMGAYLRKDGAIGKDLERVYEEFPVLRERYRQQAGSLSGGEQQMLAIGRALMANPKLLLLDEPSLGLSPLMSAGIARIITGINERQKVSVILVEQNARLALRLAQRGYVLETGEIVLEDKAENLLESKYVKKAYLGE